MTLYLIRHAHAGSKHKWSGPDDRRPLSDKGVAQAVQIAKQFAEGGIDRIITSPSLRCRQTVEPLAELLGVTIEEDDALVENMPSGPGLALLGQLAAETQTAALCSHGDVIPALMTALEENGLTGDGNVASAKAGTFILDTEHGRLTHARYVPPPDIDTVKG